MPFTPALHGADTHGGEQIAEEFFLVFLTRFHSWGIVPVVKVAQKEEIVILPQELVLPWNYLQRYFGCTSQSSNVMSGLILNFDDQGHHVFKANVGLSTHIVSAEEEFARVFRDIEESVRSSGILMELLQV